MNNHTKELLEVADNPMFSCGIKRSGSTRYLAVVVDSYDATRIVQCVNACTDMKDPWKEIAQLKADRAELFDALKWISGLGNGVQRDKTKSLPMEYGTCLTYLDNLVKRMEAN